MSTARRGAADRDRILYLLDLVGVAVFAASGALAGMAANLDLLGTLVVAAVTAIGGGTLRDLLLNRHPLFWIRDEAPLRTIIAAALLTILWVQFLPVPQHGLQVLDALGLALFAMSGATIAREQGCGGVVTVLMGTLTGTGGGVVRDVLTAKIPMILRVDFYASAAIVGIGVCLLLRRVGISERLSLGAGLVCIAGLRLSAMAFAWHLPSFHNR